MALKKKMDLTQVSDELGQLLEECGIDEGWYDWLREFTDHITHPYNAQERSHLRREILHYEQSLAALSRYLPDHVANGDCPQYKLTVLLKALDDKVCNELRR